MALTTAQIQNAYVAFFNRPADVSGLAYWSSYGGSPADLLATFAQSAEYLSDFAGKNNTQMVVTVYQNLLGREPEPAGLIYWVGQMNAGKITLANLAMAVSNGAQGADKVTVDNKTQAATAFTNALDTSAEIIAYAGAGGTAAAAVKSWLSGVTDSASLTSAVSSVNTVTTTVVSGKPLSTVSDGNAAGNTVAENAAVGAVVGLTALATDADAGRTMAYALSDSAGGKFAINTDTGVVTVNATLDFEAASSHSITVRATSSDGSTGSQSFSIAVANVNEAPVAGGATSASVSENTTSVGVYAATDVDAGDVRTYTLTGADAAKFTVNANGQVSFVDAPNFEAPGSANASNAYSINVVATDGGGLASTQAVTVNVTNVNETPTAGAAASVSVAENTTSVGTYAAADVDASTILAYSLTGADASLFNVSSAGVVTFKVAPNFETPGSANSTNTYSINVVASDGALSSSQALTVNVTNVNEAPVAGGATSAAVAENSTLVGVYAATDVDAGDVRTYTLTGC